jgi:hypothetical protein
MRMKRWWNDADRGEKNEILEDKPVSLPLFLSQMPQTLA